MTKNNYTDFLSTTLNPDPDRKNYFGSGSKLAKRLQIRPDPEMEITKNKNLQAWLQIFHRFLAGIDVDPDPAYNFDADPDFI